MWRLLLLFIPAQALADSLVALRTLPPRSVLTAEDVILVAAEIDGAMTEIAPALGLEVRTTIYAGRPVQARNLSPPALVDRNQIVALVFSAGGLTIMAEGRALERGAEGDLIRALNLASKSTISGRVDRQGRLIVGERP